MSALAAAGIGAGAQLLGGAIGGKKAKKAAKRAAEAQARAQQQMLARLDAIQDPELKQVVMQNPELVGLLEAEQLDPSRMEDISVDPRLREAQMQALQQLQERGETGFTAEDRAQLGEMRRAEDARAQAAQQGILADAAARGSADSGMALAAKLAAQQGSAQRAMESSERLAAQGAAARRQALAQAGQMSGQMAGQQFGQQAQQAQAADAIARFNAQNRQSVGASNLAARQNLADQRRMADLQNQQMANQYQQQKFSNQMAKASGQNTITQQQGQTQANLQNQLGQGAAQMYSGLGQAVASGVGSYMNYQNKQGGSGKAVEVAPTSFGDAFKQARAKKGATGTFEWKGNTYNTKHKGE